MKKWIVGIIVLVVLCVAGFAAGVFVQRLTQEKPLGEELLPQTPDAETSDVLLGMLEGGEKEIALQEEFRYTVEDGDYSITEGLDEDVMNILLLGTDGAGALNTGRTDSMIICSINTKTGTVKLSSIVRDLYVQLPGMKSKNKINAANSFGGPNMAIKCVNETFGLNISRYISVNFTAFRELVDLVGGVELEISNAEARQISTYTAYPVSGGTRLLNGAQALYYCRIRNLDNNFGRNERQRKFLDAMVKKVVSGNSMDQLMALVETGMKYVDTNLSTSDLFTILFNVVPNMSEMQMYSCPAEGEFHYEQVDDISVVVGSMDQVNASLHAFIYGAEAE